VSTQVVETVVVDSGARTGKVAAGLGTGVVEAGADITATKLVV